MRMSVQGCAGYAFNPEQGQSRVVAWFDHGVQGVQGCAHVCVRN
jgi:hypothetical protein